MKIRALLLTFSAILSVSLSLQAETVWLEKSDFASEVAQGDGDYEAVKPLISLDEEVSLQAQSLKQAAENPQKETINDKTLPTLTAEGDFLLPTYVATETQAPAPTKIASVDEKNPWRQESPSPTTTTTRTRRTYIKNVPVIPVSAQGITLSGSDQASSNEKETKLLESIEKQYQDTTSLLETTANRLSALEAGLENLAKKSAVEPELEVVEIAPKNAGVSGKITVGAQQEKRSVPLLLPLAPIRTKPVAQSVNVEDDDVTMTTSIMTPKVEYVDYVLNVIKKNLENRSAFSESDELILRSIPKEMKISFLPSTADLSDQALKWIKIFAFNPTRNVSNAVEIRISPENLDLQSRRFALIKGILMSNGVSARQVRFVFTDRDIDTVVLRNITLPDEMEYVTQQNPNGIIEQQIIQRW